MAEWTTERHQAVRARLEAIDRIPDHHWYRIEGDIIEIIDDDMPDALDAIEAKDAEIVRLRAALAPFATYYTRHVNSGFASGIDESEIGIAYISSNDPQNPGVRISLRDVHTAFDTLNGGT